MTVNERKKVSTFAATWDVEDLDSMEHKLYNIQG